MFVKPIQSQKQQANNQTYRPGQRVPVLTAESLLSHQKYKNYIYKIKGLSHISEEYFNELYEVFLCQFAEFVQVLPSQKEGAFCSLLNEGLLRGCHILQQWSQGDADVTPIERYAIFTAGVLKDVSRAVIHQKLFIVDDEGNWLKEWQPLMGALPKDPLAKFYKIIYQGPEYQRLRSTLTPLLARQLMPESGFLWLASQQKIFSEWLAILCGEQSQGGRVEGAFQLFETLIDAQDLPGLNISLENSNATIHADAFLAWLQEALAKGEVKVNSDSGVYRTPDGMFLELSEKSGVFKQFADLYLTPVDMFTVFQQLGNLLGLTKQSGSDYRNERLFSESPDIKGKFSLSLAHAEHGSKNGIMFNSNLLDLKGNISNFTTSLRSAPAATRMQNMPSLNLQAANTSFHVK